MYDCNWHGHCQSTIDVSNSTDLYSNSYFYSAELWLIKFLHLNRDIYVRMDFNALQIAVVVTFCSIFQSSVCQKFGSSSSNACRVKIYNFLWFFCCVDYCNKLGSASINNWAKQLFWPTPLKSVKMVLIWFSFTCFIRSWLLRKLVLRWLTLCSDIIAIHPSFFTSYNALKLV